MTKIIKIFVHLEILTGFVFNFVEINVIVYSFAMIDAIETDPFVSKCQYLFFVTHRNYCNSEAKCIPITLQIVTECVLYV